MMVLSLVIQLAVSAPFFPTGKIIDSVVCGADPRQSYALYIPVKGGREPLPVIYLFDPHGDGGHPIRKYRSLADAYGFILIGSNNSKNGNDFRTTENIWKHLSEDSRARLAINSNRIYTCGFSGGAKVAGYVALQHPEIKGVIANGAGLPDGVSAGDLDFSFTAVVGEGDLNLTDLVALNGALDKSRTRHRIIFFDGKHEWASLDAMDKAFTGLQLDAMRAGVVPRDNAFISRYIAGSKARVDSHYKTKDLIRAGQEAGLSIRLLDGLTDEVAWFRERASALAGNNLYRQQLQMQTNLLAGEQHTKADYMQHFQSGDPAYWTKIIQDLQTGVRTRVVEKGMYQRLLAYLSLAFYSISNQLINAGRNSEARHFVDLYKMADASNSEAWYFSALLHARDRQVAATENDLLRAAHEGFKDRVRMTHQVEFQQLSPALDLSRVENKMRTADH